MFHVRSLLILGGAPAGLVLGAAAWLLLGDGSFAAEETAALEARLASVSAAARPRAGGGAAVAQAAVLPLFPTDPASLKEATVVLQGVARSPRRHAALLAIDGRPAQWLERGQTVDGVTLVAVDAAKAVVETADGRRDVGFWDKGASAAAIAPGAPGTAPSDLPPGVRLPPAPASAPAA